MAPREQLAESALLYSLARIAGAATFVVLYALCSHLLPADDYGSFRQVWTLNKGILDIFLLGVPMSILYFLPRIASGERRRFVVQSMALLTGLAALLAAGLFLGSDAIAQRFHNPRLVGLLQLFCLYPLFALPPLALESLLIAIDRAREYSLFLVIDRLGLLATAVVVLCVAGTVESLFLAFIAFALGELAVSVVLIRRYLWAPAFAPAALELAAPRTAGLREQLRFALPSGMANMVDVLNGEVDKLLAASFFTLERFATYVNGAFEVPFFSTITGSISAVLIPQFVQHHQQGQRAEFLSLWNGSITRIAMLITPLAVLLFLVAPDLVTLLFSSRYADSASVFRIYLLVLIPKLAWYGAALVSMGLTRAPLYGSLLAMVCNLVLNLVLIPRLGLIGPAVATVITSHLLTAYYLHLFRRCLAAGWSEVFPWLQVGKIALVSLAAGLMALPVTRIDAPWSLLRMALDGAAFTVALALLYRAFAIVSPADLAFVAGRLRRLRTWS